MTDSPVSATPYEILGVTPDISHDDLRSAYRQRLRETHPDTGGSPAMFIAVQAAWERIGTPEDRAAYDRNRSSGGSTTTSWAPRSAPPQRTESRPKARAFGHPGGWRRERYNTLLREWVGRGVDIPDPYDAALVRSAPREIRHILADALSEEATARTLAELGLGYTIWHDVATGSPAYNDAKIDHIVLGPTGLWALLSEDYGAPVRTKGGEIIGEAGKESLQSGEKPMHDFAARVKLLSRRLRVKFTYLVIVLPDEQLSEPVTPLGAIRGAKTVLVKESHLGILIRDGLPGMAPVGGNELFDVRTRLQSGVQFV